MSISATPPPPACEACERFEDPDPVERGDSRPPSEKREICRSENLMCSASRRAECQLTSLVSERKGEEVGNMTSG